MPSAAMRRGRYLPTSRNPVDRGRVLYVDSAATGTGDGSSWANAFTTLVAALAAASSGQEIWIAGATGAGKSYSPGETAGSTFQMIAGVGVYGGFAGGETRRASRKPATNLTYLTGGNVCAHVVTGGVATVLSGVIIYRGYNEDASGAGMLGAVSVLDTVAFVENACMVNGNGLYNDPENDGGLSSFTLRSCLFYDNDYYDPETYYALGEKGGGLYFDNSTANIYDCEFKGNMAGSGAAIYKGLAGTLNMVGGSVHDHVEDENMPSNTGAVHVKGGATRVVGVDFYDNSFVLSLANGGAIYLETSAGATGEITDCNFLRNKVGGNGGGCFTPNTGFVYDGCLFDGNESGLGGGGLSTASTAGAAATVKNCVFVRNVSGGLGGGIHGQNITQNCLFAGNSAGTGGGIHGQLLTGSTGVTVIGNSATNAQGGLLLGNSTVLKNSIIWGNTAATDPNLTVASGGQLTYSCVEGVAVPGDGNITADPLLVSAADYAAWIGADEAWWTADDGLRLGTGSPCLGTGENGANMGAY